MGSRLNSGGWSQGKDFHHLILEQIYHYFEMEDLFELDDCLLLIL